MGGLVINKGAKIKGTLASGTGDPLLTRDTATSDLGTISNFGTLTNGKIYIGNVSNVPTEQTVSGDITLSNTGVVGISTGVIVNSDVNASAAIGLSKLAATTASRALVSDGSGFITASLVTATEIGYSSGVTSAIQTQLNAKQATITGAASSVVSSNLSNNIVAVSDGSGKITSSAVSTTALGYISTLSSSAQTQLNTKLTTSLGSLANGDIIYYNGSNWTNLPRGTNGQALYSTGATIQWNTPTINGIPIGGSSGQYLAKNSGVDFDASWTTLTLSKVTDVSATSSEVNKLSGVTTTSTQFNYLNTTTSDVQSQLNNKLGTALAQNAIFVGNSSNIAAGYAAGSNGQVLQIVAGVPTWQTVVGTGTVTSVDVSGGSTGLTTSGGPVSTTGTITVAGTLNETHGGTGLTSYTTGDILYSSASNVLSKLAIGSNGNILTVSGGVPVWSSASSANPTTGSFFLRGNGSGGFFNLVSPSDGQLIMKVTGPDFANSNISSDGTTATFGAVPNFPSQTQNKFFASPNGSSGVPSFRAIVSDDIPVDDTDVRNYVANDFIWSNYDDAFAVDNSGAGSSGANDTYGVDNTSHANGVFALNTGTTTTGYADLQRGGANIKLGIGTTMKFRIRAALPTLSDGTNTYTVYFGLFGSAFPGESNDGVYFKYSSAVNSGKWLAVTASGGTRTSTDTGITANTSYAIFEYTINAAGTSVTFKINGSTVATNTTNIPSGFLNGLFFGIEKSAGTTNRKVVLDWYDFLMTRTSPR